MCVGGGVVCGCIESVSASVNANGGTAFVAVVVVDTSPQN